LAELGNHFAYGPDRCFRFQLRGENGSFQHWRKGNRIMATAPSPSMQNAAARQIVAANAVTMQQQIYTNTFNPANGVTLNIAPRNVGLILGFLVEVSGGVTNGGGTAADRTGLGSSNVVQNVTFTDLNNIQRIKTTGPHLALLNSARQGFGFGGAYAPNLPMSFGNNWSPFSAPVQIAAAGTGTLKHTFYVPIAYSPQDLRGAIYAAVVNATMNLQLQIATSAQLAVAAGADPSTAVYIGNDALAWTNTVTVNVTQIYLDQLPVGAGNIPILPMQDLNTIYDLKITTQTGMAVGQDFPVDYANYRTFLSTMPFFVNGTTMNVNDVNYWSLKAANNTELFRLSADLCALQARATFMADPPAGVFYFDHRQRPIDVLSYGNMQLILNASTVNANAKLLMGYEAFQTPQATSIAGSLPGG
jgi:hypothetical protein